MSLDAFKKEISDEVSTILDSSFSIGVTRTQEVPHSSDPAITFPNLDERTQGTKLIETCVLYIDIRRSTELNLVHKQQTVAKLYSAFVRAMTRCANQFGGHVRGIIGDRVMVVFDAKDCFTSAVDTAMLMNSVAQYVINRYFTRNEVRCGIGIDYGRMLATKTGVRRRGNNQHTYRSLVWLGRPANVASKLTDIANKPRETFELDRVRVGYNYGHGLVWKTESPWHFTANLRMQPSGNGAYHIDPHFQTCYPVTEMVETRSQTPAILMTKAVYDGFRSARPQADILVNKWLRRVDVSVPEYSGEVYGGDFWFKIFEP